MPKFVPATVHELQRVGLLASLSGETLNRLASLMQRENIPAGEGVIEEGAKDERFYVLLTGMMTVSQKDLGPRRVLRPGDYFGEVAAAMRVPRTASVRALTPSVVASCDRATFEELIKPLFADA